jgi:hypothetical protein
MEVDVRSLLTSLAKALARQQNSDTWEFGKGALSESRVCGVAAGKRLEVGGGRPKGKCQMPNVKVQNQNGRSRGSSNAHESHGQGFPTSNFDMDPGVRVKTAAGFYSFSDR